MSIKIEKNQPSNKTHVFILLDDSGSMRRHALKTLETFNRTIKDIQAEVKRTKQIADLSLYLFGEVVTREIEAMPIAKIKGLTHFDPRAGCTVLRDGIGKALQDAFDLDGKTGQQDSFLFIVLTDGLENGSHRFGVFQLQQDVARAHATDRFTITALAPPDCVHHLRAFGLPEGNIKAYDANTEYGIEEAAVARTKGVASYFTSRAGGMRSVKNFYQTNAANINTRDLNKLDDVTRKVKVWEVPAETSIQDFVEKKTKVPYVRGTVFYELTKKEKAIQSYKKLLIQSKTDGRVFEGDAARQLLGLPDKDAPVIPGNHGNFNIFVQSTSTNRKLVRGSKVIFHPTAR